MVKYDSSVSISHTDKGYEVTVSVFSADATDKTHITKKQVLSSLENLSGLMSQAVDEFNTTVRS